MSIGNRVRSNSGTYVSLVFALEDLEVIHMVSKSNDVILCPQVIKVWR